MDNTFSFSATTTNQVDHVLYPLYVAPNDNSGLHISSTQFTGSNFINWSRQIKTGLAAKHKIGFINGTVTKTDDKNSVNGQK